MFLSFPAVPLSMVGLVSIASLITIRKKNVQRGLTANERKILDTLLNAADEQKLKKMADVFRAEGFTDEADQLEKRANLRALPPETKEKRREIFRKAMASTNVDGLKEYAAALRAEGCTGAAAAVQQRIDGLVHLAEAS